LTPVGSGIGAGGGISAPVYRYIIAEFIGPERFNQMIK